MDSEINSYAALALLANICQLDSWQMNRKSLSNEHLLKYLQHQDSDYLNKIIEQNDIIIAKLNKILQIIDK